MSDVRPWIHVPPDDEAPDAMRQIYAEFDIDPQAVDHILSIHSADPPTLRAHLSLYRLLMFGKSGLSRPEREMIGVTVSVANKCHY